MDEIQITSGVKLGSLGVVMLDDRLFEIASTDGDHPLTELKAKGVAEALRRQDMFDEIEVKPRDEAGDLSSSDHQSKDEIKSEYSRTRTNPTSSRTRIEVVRWCSFGSVPGFRNANRHYLAFGQWENILQVESDIIEIFTQQAVYGIVNAANSSLWVRRSNGLSPRWGPAIL